MSFYDKYILPSLINCACGTKPMRYQRQKIVPLAEGSVLEIGIGSGLNLPFYDLGKINKIWGLDPSTELNSMAKNVSTTIDVEVDFIIAGAEEIPLPDNSIDTVLLTYTLCTIAEVKDSIREMERVLKASGRMLFCEHGLAPDEKVVKWQERLNPFWKKIAGGCHLNRNIPEIIEDSKFKIVKVESMYLPRTPKFAGFNYWGEARVS
ncbi:MAG: class I SAM-dependent methyltransferase [SAR86 cluster bacterium]|nr:class I SAM-dependent methyltransferase [SAR86 cluster bacterium]